jgi:3-methylfumaryl-CoA hydratase
MSVIDETDAVPSSAALALHGLLNAPGPAPAQDEPLPALWHWLAFLPRVSQREIGHDGHPRRPVESQPEKYPQRMFAGGKIDIVGTALIDQSLHRQSKVVSSTEKSGKSGQFLLTSVQNILKVDGEIVVAEVQDIVYRSATKKAESSPETIQREIEGDFTWGIDVDIGAVTLFRFSALTYNAHRIHYDRHYAQEVEGYPGLVVHGPLQAIYLAELCRRNAPDAPIVSFQFRALRPMFDGGLLHLRALKEDQTVTLSAFDQYGQQTMSAVAELAASH